MIIATTRRLQSRQKTLYATPEHRSANPHTDAAPRRARSIKQVASVGQSATDHHAKLKKRPSRHTGHDMDDHSPPHGSKASQEGSSRTRDNRQTTRATTKQHSPSQNGPSPSDQKHQASSGTRAAQKSRNRTGYSADHPRSHSRTRELDTVKAAAVGNGGAAARPQPSPVQRRKRATQVGLASTSSVSLPGTSQGTSRRRSPSRSPAQRAADLVAPGRNPSSSRGRSPSGKSPTYRMGNHSATNVAQWHLRHGKLLFLTVGAIR